IPLRGHRVAVRGRDFGLMARELLISERVARTMRNAVVLFATLVCVAATSGCKSRMLTCRQSDQEYATAQEVPPLQAPPGLETPDTRNALKIPPLNTP